MDPITLLIVAISLAMDSFAVSLGIGTTGQANRLRPIFRLSFHLGLFQGLMTFFGWLGGSRIAAIISNFDHWVIFGLLAYVGGSMIRSSLDPHSATYSQDPSRGRTLIMLSIACSLDAMAVGLSLGMLHVNILWACLVIALVSSAFSLGGLLAGHQLGTRFGKRMEMLGGILLIGIGLRILYLHMF